MDNQENWGAWSDRDGRRDPDRQTGRTTRLLQEAVRRVTMGEDIVFVVHHAAMIRYASALARSIIGNIQLVGAASEVNGRFRLGSHWLRIVTKEYDTRGLRPTVVMYDHA